MANVPQNYSNYQYNSPKADERPGMAWVLLGLAIYAYDFFFKFGGIDWPSFWNIASSGQKQVYINGIILIALVVHLVFSTHRGDTKEAILNMVSFYILVLVLSIVMSMGGAVWYNALVHFIFAGCFLYFVLMKNDSFTSRYQANFTLLVLLLIDFFLFSSYGYNKLLIPVWFFAAIIFTKPSRIKSWLTVFVILFYVFHFIGSVNIYGGSNPIMMTGKEVNDLKLFASKSWNNFKGFFTGMKQGAFDEYNRTMSGTLGDYYTSEVDRNVGTQLGLSIIDIKATDAYIYEDTPITVYARIQGRTLGEEIMVRNFCQADTALPDAILPSEHKIAGYSEFNVDCIFNACRFSQGTRTISFHIGFDFSTMSYLRNYFMDRDRLNAMIREYPDVTQPSDALRFYGITNTNPIALSTSGPVKIGVELESNQPVTIDRTGDDMTFRLGITLENAWTGKIKNVKDVIIMLPKQMSLEHDIGTTAGTYCGGYVFTPVTCSDIFKEGDDEWCDDSINNIYNIDQSGSNLKVIAPGQPGIDRYKSLICRVSLPKSQFDSFLGNSPVAVENFKVMSRYNYEFTRSLPITIRRSELGGCGQTTSEDGLNLIQCSGYNVDPSDRVPTVYQERYRKYQSAVQNIIKVHRLPPLNDAKAESLLAAIMTSASDMGLTDSNNNNIPDFIAGYGTNFPENFIDNPFDNIDNAAKRLKELLARSTAQTEDAKVKDAIKRYSDEFGLSLNIDQTFKHYTQWQNTVCKHETEGGSAGTGTATGGTPGSGTTDTGSEQPIGIITLFKKNDIVGVDKNNDKIWSTVGDEFYFITDIRRGADNSWVYGIKASHNPQMTQVRVDAFEYYRNIESNSHAVMVQRPASEPDWNNFVFMPTNTLSDGAVV